MKKPSHNEKRAHYRMPYPMSERPTIRCEDGDYEVVELSEGGARLVLTAGSVVQKDQSFAGVIQFRDGETAAVEGVVLRYDKERIVVNLTSGVSLKRMLTEQVWIHQKYPMFFETVEEA